MLAGDISCSLVHTPAVDAFNSIVNNRSQNILIGPSNCVYRCICKLGIH